MGWGDGGDIAIQTKIMQLAHLFHRTDQIPPFIDWICSAGDECGATAEITQSLQIDLVLSDAEATSEP